VIQKKIEKQKKDLKFLFVWRRRTLKKTKLIIAWLMLIPLTLIIVFPFYWAVQASFRKVSEMFSMPALWIHNPTIINYINLFVETLFPRWFFNSFFISLSFTVLALFFCSLGGYGFAKYEFKGKNILFIFVIASLMFPAWVTVIPLFIWFMKLHLINTYWALIIPGSANAFGIFLMRQYIQGIPSELMDSARIDGCSEFQIYYRIILPVIKPAVGALSILFFLNSWNNFIGGLIFLRTEEMFTIPVGLARLMNPMDPQYGLLMAGSVLSTLPIVIVFIRMQKTFISGLTLGALKG